jgi:DNA-binding NarL/FixJ family response regulator
MVFRVAEISVVSSRNSGGPAYGERSLAMSAAIRIAWIDSHRLIRECMSGTLAALNPSLTLTGYESVEDCIGKNDASSVDLIVYHIHNLGIGLGGDVSALQQAIERRPIVLLSDAEDANQIATIRDALKSGANGYVCTRTSTISMALASLLFVQAGGTFAPLELLLNEDATESFVREPLPSDRLTDRQMTVLAQVKQGKANKAIARELGMSESAVKVHIRSIMRKMGAANRTQAAFASMDSLGHEDPPAKQAVDLAGRASFTSRAPDQEGDDRDA